MSYDDVIKNIESVVIIKIEIKCQISDWVFLPYDEQDGSYAWNWAKNEEEVRT